MTDTLHQTSAFRHRQVPWRVLGLAAVFIGITLRCLAVQGELWLDELWSLLHVADLSDPIAIFTSVKHDNNHLLNSVWLWFLGSDRTSVTYRLPSLFFSIVLLMVLFRNLNPRQGSGPSAMWLILVATSYPVILYCTEARGYSLTVLMSAIGYLALQRLIDSPSDTKAMVSFSVASVIGCISHAIYILFLAPAIVWVGYCIMTSSIRSDSRNILRLALLPPILVACALTVTFYTGMEIGGAPLLPYLEVAASTISVSFGGEPLSATNPSVTGWSVFLAIFVVTVCLSELFLWLRSKDPCAVLVALIIITPWVAVTALQPHFILPRYFLIQVVFAYLLMARFLSRLLGRNFIGKGVAALMLLSIVSANTRHTYQLWTLGRSHFLRIFHGASTAPSVGGQTPSIGGDQDFQNSLRLRYAKVRILGVVPLQYHRPLAYVQSYRTSTEKPLFIVRETLDAFEVLPPSFTLPSGATYNLIRTFKAPPLSGSHVFVYELSEK